MKEFKGTKGEWYWSNIASELIEGSESSKLLAPKGKSIGRVHGTHKEEGYANLKLIAAAPELLEALQELVFYWSNPDYADKKEREAIEATDGNLDYLNDVLINGAKSAIKKAIGE